MCDAGLFEFNRALFGLKCSGNTFESAINEIPRPVRDYAESFVDDMAVQSDQWEEHLIHLARFLKTIRDAVLKLNLKNCRWA